MVRPERLFALRAHPFGAALRAFSAEAALCSRQTPLVLRFAPDRRRAARVDVQLGRRRPSCRTPLSIVGSSNLKRRILDTRKGFSYTKYNGAPGEIASGPSAPRPPLRSGSPVATLPVTKSPAAICRTRLFVRREFELTSRMSGAHKGFSGKNYNGAPGEIRTPDLLVRSQALYPTELRARVRHQHQQLTS